MLKYSTRKMIDVGEWDDLVISTYNKPYSFQQQYGCQSRGIVNITIPTEWNNDKNMHDSIPEKVNGPKMGVKFDIWLSRDPKQPLADEEEPSSQWEIDLWWDRNFYPDLQTVANDLYTKGLIEAGDYSIEIDW